VQRYTRVLLSFLAGFSFFPPVISSYGTANFGFGGGNRRIKSRRPIRVVAALLAVLCLGVLAAYAQTPQTAGGKGGDAVAGSNTGVIGTGSLLTIDSGTISGGVAGDGMTRANAVDFFNGVNTLELRAGFNIVGNAVSHSGTANGGDTLALGGTADSSFDVALIDNIPQNKQLYWVFYP
jgi:hypothetical protein